MELQKVAHVSCVSALSTQDFNAANVFALLSTYDKNNDSILIKTHEEKKTQLYCKVHQNVGLTVSFKKNNNNQLTKPVQLTQRNKFM